MERRCDATKSETFPLTENARTVLEKRYLARGDDGRVIESPEDLFRRVAGTVAEVDGTYGDSGSISEREDRYFEMMAGLEFLPNSPTLMNAGRGSGQLSACFVLPVEDSIPEIFGAAAAMAKIHQSGGGTGFSFSRLRPKDDRVRTSGGVASGPVSFMRIFDLATDVVKQGGRRRGANMGVLRIDHPDIVEFIEAKKDRNAFRNFNLSVAVTDSFMKRLEDDSYYDLVNPRNGSTTGTLKAKEVWQLMAETAWLTGDPGVLYLDRINAAHPLRALGEIEATNPCGEQPLLPNESCNLGSINLRQVITSGKLDGQKLDRLVRDAVRFLDGIIDANRYPLEKIQETTRANRKIGLGVMGFADMLAMLGIPYASSEALQTGDALMRRIAQQAVAASVELGRSRGSFPSFHKSEWARRGLETMRNATVTTVAPTGTISIIAGCSSGIEPFFGLSFTRKVLDGSELTETNDLFLAAARAGGFDDRAILEEVARRGSVRGLTGVPEVVQAVFPTAFDIPAEWHVRMQAAFQKHTDNAVSKTINLASDATAEDVKTIYRLAWDLGCKGITVFRYGCRDDQVLFHNGHSARLVRLEGLYSGDCRACPI